jgi:hypothetical protein
MQEDTDHLVEVRGILFRDLGAARQLRINAWILGFQFLREAVPEILRQGVADGVYGRVVSQGNPPGGMFLAPGALLHYKC